MKFAGLQKTTLLDYPGKIAATLFTYGCNFRCPFCHNPELVVEDFKQENSISEDYVLDFLKSRVGKLDALVVTGGEPLLHRELLEFLQKVKDLGFLIKVDTNGSFPDEIQRYLDAGIVDYWAMDIKNSEERYLETNGLNNVVTGLKPVTTERCHPELVSESQIKKVRQSISLIMNSGADYEFRTTVVQGLHDEESIHGIGKLIRGAKAFYIQNFRSGKTIDKSYSAKRSFTEKELKVFEKIMKEFVRKVEVRGI